MEIPPFLGISFIILVIFTVFPKTSLSSEGSLVNSAETCYTGAAFFGRLNRHILFLARLFFMHSQFYRLAELKRDLRRRLRSAQVSPRAMTALYTGLLLVWISSFSWAAATAYFPSLSGFSAG